MIKGISILDCTLRDGGYCNEWNFGNTNIHKCIGDLTLSNIDIVECGFVSEKVSFDPDRTVFDSIDRITQFIPVNHKNTEYVAMINFGECKIDAIPNHKPGMIDGIRIAFHKKDAKQAIEFCKSICEKGYKVFIQAMVSMNYRDDEFVRLISDVNKLSPYAFYIVDSFGTMKKNDIMRYFGMVLDNLDDSIIIGFHSHNNLQLAYSNAITILENRVGRNVIVDSSVYGMGRGAGNLNTELFVDYLNNEYDADYIIGPILTMMDDVINYFYQKSPWGYSLSNYLSAVHNVHPNYAGYLSDKHTLTVESMNRIFDLMDEGKKAVYSKEYAESLYLKLMCIDEIREGHRVELKEKIHNKTVMLIAPGKTSCLERDRIVKKLQSEDIISISINHDYRYKCCDYIFVSNNRRYRDLSDDAKVKCITTTNIIDYKSYAQLKYADLINHNKDVFDNCGLMAIKMLIDFGVSKILLAGFDGYGSKGSNDYADVYYQFVIQNDVADAINHGMKAQINDYSKLIPIEFVTESIYSK